MTHLVYLEKRPLQVFLLLLQIMLLLVLNLQIRAVKFMISLTDVYFLPVAIFLAKCLYFFFLLAVQLLVKKSVLGLLN